MRYFKISWLLTNGVTVIGQFLTQVRNMSNNSIQNLPNQLTNPHNYTYIDNINTTDISVTLDTQIEEMASNNFGIKNAKEFLQSKQTLLGKEQQINSHNSLNDISATADNDISDFRPKRSIKQNQSKYKGESTNQQQSKVVKLNIKPGDFINLYESNLIKQEVEAFTAYIEMPDGTSQPLPSIFIKNLDNRSEMHLSPTLKYTLPDNYLHFRLDTLPNNQPAFVFINEEGSSFVDSIRVSSEVIRNQISHIRAPNNIQHYPVNTTFDLQPYPSESHHNTWLVFHNSTEVTRLPNTQVLLEIFNNNNTDIGLFIRDRREIYADKANNLQVHITQNVTYLHNDGALIDYFPLMSEYIFSQKFLDSEFKLQGLVTCGDKLYDIDRNRTITLATITTPSGQTLQLPSTVVKASADGIKMILAGQKYTSIVPEYQNIKLIEYNNNKYFMFCDTTPKLPHCANYIQKVPSAIEDYPLNTEFQLGTSNGKVIIFHDNVAVGTLSDTAVYCEVVNTDPPGKFIHRYSLDSNKHTISHQRNTYFVLEEGKDIAIKTYKEGEEDVYIKPQYIGSIECWPDDLLYTTALPTAASVSTMLDEPAISVTTKSTSSSTQQSDSTTVASTRNSLVKGEVYTTATTAPSPIASANITLDEPAISVTTKSTSSSTKQSDSTTVASTRNSLVKGEVYTTATTAPSPIASANITLDEPAISVTTKSTSSSTQQSDSTVSTNTEHNSKISTAQAIILETVHSSTIVSPENSSTFDDVFITEVTNTNQNDSGDTHNNDYTNKSSTFGIVGILCSVLGGTLAIYKLIWCYFGTKQNMRVIKYQPTIGNSMQSEENECKPIPLKEKLYYNVGRPLPNIPTTKLPNTHEDRSECSNKEEDTVQIFSDPNVYSSDNDAISTPGNSSARNKLYEAVAYLESQTSNMPTYYKDHNNQVNISGEEYPLYETIPLV